jgi:hypothetical protein
MEIPVVKTERDYRKAAPAGASVVRERLRD